MPTVLAGGTGTPKLLWGIDPVFPPESLTVLANTGDDVEMGGLFVCPDIDSVLYGQSDRLDRDRWWGQEDDSTATHDELAALTDELGRSQKPRYLSDEAQTAGRELSRWRRFSAVPEFLHLGDRDRAVHLFRTSLLDEGYSLTAVTERLATVFGLDLELRPMSDDPVVSVIHTPGRVMHFQEFWVAHNGEPAVEEVEFRGADQAEATDAVLEALEDPVIIGPANPITSIGPMLALDGVSEALEQTTVVAVSPFVEDRVFSGPAAKLMRAAGYEASTRGVAEAYPFADAFVLDSADSTALSRPSVRTDTAIESQADATRVARAIKRAMEQV